MKTVKSLLRIFSAGFERNLPKKSVIKTRIFRKKLMVKKSRHCNTTEKFYNPINAIFIRKKQVHSVHS